MLLTFIAQAAESSDGGNALLGFVMIIGIIWFVAYLCTPKNRGWNIHHEGRTTVKPRK